MSIQRPVAAWLGHVPVAMTDSCAIAAGFPPYIANRVLFMAYFAHTLMPIADTGGSLADKTTARTSLAG
jgi:hypothetical protein